MKVYLVLKRFVDFALAVSSLLVLFIPILIIGLLIRLESKGPVFLVGKRIGRNGKIFKIYEFRTKTYDRDAELTIMGKLLGKTKLDEVPHVINIIKGDMSIIGPRPFEEKSVSGFNMLSDFEKKRFEVLPGTTGLAQIALEDNSSWDEEVELDVEYVENLNCKLDTDIFLKTIFVSVRG